VRTILTCLALVVAGASSGCNKDDAPGERFSCSCDFLTDMDDASVQKVEVCAESASVASERAVGCAQSGAPATVQACRCERMAKDGCPPNDCLVLERR